MVVETKACGKQPSMWLRLAVPIPAQPAASAGPVCVRYDEVFTIWRSEGLSTSDSVNGRLECLSRFSNGIFAVAFRPLPTATPTVDSDADKINLPVEVITASGSVCCLACCVAAIFSCRRWTSAWGYAKDECNLDDEENQEPEGIVTLPRNSLNVTLPAGCHNVAAVDESSEDSYVSQDYWAGGVGLSRSSSGGSEEDDSASYSSPPSRSAFNIDVDEYMPWATDSSTQQPGPPEPLNLHGEKARI